MKKKLIAAMLAAFMLLALALPAAAADGDAEAAPVSRTGFSDVVVGAWYEDAVDWAVDEGIVLGIGDGLFGVGQELTLAQAGEPWFEVDTEVDLIPDGDTELVIHVKPVFEGDTKDFILDIAPVIGKNERLCRLGLRLRFQDAKTAIFTIRDKGFGDTMPGSNRVWEETIACS